MMPYADSLKLMSDWYAQLWAESLGKNVTLHGKPVNVGQTPVKTLGVTDQHSQLQLYTEGPFDKVVTFLKVENFRAEDPHSPRLRRHPHHRLPGRQEPQPVDRGRAPGHGIRPPTARAA